MVNDQDNNANDYLDTYILSNKTDNYTIPFFKKPDTIKTITDVNMFASGPSIETVDFTSSLLNTPAIFVNGSLSLTKQYHFENVLAYVITDERFIEHQLDLLNSFYKGYPLYATIEVLEALLKKSPDLVGKYNTNFTIIYPVDKPHLSSSNATTTSKSTKSRWFSSLLASGSKKLKLSELENDSSYKIHLEHKPKPIGVSFDVSKGFVEAGTVAYVATQLAFSLGAKNIHLYGIDLINSNEPRFYESNDTMAPCKLEKAVENRIIPSFDLLAYEYNQLGVKVINHSPVSIDLFKNLSLPK